LATDGMSLSEKKTDTPSAGAWLGSSIRMVEAGRAAVHSDFARPLHALIRNWVAFQLHLSSIR